MTRPRPERGRKADGKVTPLAIGGQLFPHVVDSVQTDHLGADVKVKRGLLAFMDYKLSTAVWVGIIAVAAETGIVMIVYLDEAFARYRREGRSRCPRTLTPRSGRGPPRACGHRS